MVVVKDHQQREPSMGDITTIGLDLTKNVFQVHAVDQAGNVVVRKRIRRGQVLAFFSGIPTCLVGLEACATAHHWARELIALGHDARLMPPNYVKAYVKRNKHDLADAEAICEAVRGPSMRFVPLKTTEQQSALMMHRARVCCSGVLVATNRMFGLVTASQIASASVASFLCRFT
jgi:transposase